MNPISLFSGPRKSSRLNFISELVLTVSVQAGNVAMAELYLGQQEELARSLITNGVLQ